MLLCGVWLWDTSVPVPQLPSSETYIQTTASESKYIYDMIIVTIYEAGQRIYFIAKHIFKSVFTINAITAPKIDLRPVKFQV